MLKDKEDGVRVAAVKCLRAIVPFSSQSVLDELLKMVQKSMDDPSAKVVSLLPSNGENVIRVLLLYFFVAKILVDT